MSWRRLLTHWRLVEADLHEFYGIDLEETALLKRRSWRWLQVRIFGLLDKPAEVVTYGEFGAQMAMVPTTRIGYALNPPKFGP